ncbi:GntR family transcriptional regulator [Arsenicitalea aurantiaca]|uniref:GntR family transcriptional regulator n=1 Tax=Arsenicitalea aurantiaca TaxID=1783274 RepID=A0A433XEH3_9HYPH|nr:GntR family transcriptional regulator [Arsenicitalea aurantiaca]RUT32495.1 GntR family transcriptional regulator [Arsenicitalea aurantiaca]
MFATDPAPQVKTRSTAQNVFELLRQDIVMGVLRPTEPIREAEIAARLGVSRTPVREALLRLAGLGLVEIYPQSGTRVAPIRIEKVKAAQLIREVVEVEVVRRAALKASASDIAALREIVEDQAVAARRNDAPWFFDRDEAFHNRLHVIAGLESVAEELEDLKVHLNRLRYVTLNWPRRSQDIISDHASMIDAVERGDGDGAARAMQDHLRTVLGAMQAAMASAASETAAPEPRS